MLTVSARAPPCAPSVAGSASRSVAGPCADSAAGNTLPSELRSVSRVRPGSLAPTRTFVDRAIRGDIGEVESDYAVEAGDGLVHDSVEDPSALPLVSSRAHGGVRDPVAAQALRIDPRTPCGQSDHHHLEAVPVGFAPPMATERVGICWSGDERLHRCPDSVLYFGIESTHDGTDLHSVVGCWVTTPILSGPSPRPVDGLSARKSPVQRPFFLSARPLR